MDDTAKAAPRIVDTRVLTISALAVAAALGIGVVAQGLLALIRFVTNVSFYGRFSVADASPAGNHLGLWILAVPVLGGVVVGLMARYGSKAIRGHGIPEAMEQVLTKKSRVPARLTILKPLSAAVAIGTGGPFGAEGPIIATGGAFGSLAGQLFHTTAVERKTLLAAGAAAGMAATFGSPISAVILAVELLLFEFHPRSLIPVALASAAAAGVRMLFVGAAPMFPMDGVASFPARALMGYAVLGAVVGACAVGATRIVYLVEDLFDRLPVHWMWAPAIGGVAVGVFGWFNPRTLGVGHGNNTDVLTGTVAGRAAISLCVLKFLSWAISLGSGTSGGTLAPLFTIGGALGSALAAAGAWLAPGLGLDPRMGAFVGMAAIFTGASRALLASVVFALETTWQPLGIAPLLGGCAAAYLVSALFMSHTIMTEKIARRGVHVPQGYAADPLERMRVSEAASSPVITLPAAQTVEQARLWIESGAEGSGHQGFPVVDSGGGVIGMLARRDIGDRRHDPQKRLGELAKSKPAVAFSDDTLVHAARLMMRLGVGRLPVVERSAPSKPVAILTRGDILAAEAREFEDHHRAERSLSL